MSKSFISTHPFEIWQGLPGLEVYSGNRFSNLQTAALSVVIHSEMRRLYARSVHMMADFHKIQLRYLGNVYGLGQCKEFLVSGEQISAWKPVYPVINSPISHRVCTDPLKAIYPDDSFLALSNASIA